MISPDYDEAYLFSAKWETSLSDVELRFTQLPNILIHCQAHLKLKDGELISLIQLISHWYRTDKDVYPSITRLARYSGKDYNTVQRRLMNLEKKGFIFRQTRVGYTNIYDFEPLVRKLATHAKDCLDPPHKWKGYPTDTISPVPTTTSNKEYELGKIPREKKKRSTAPPYFSSLDDMGSIL